jgi:hypothetical protein
MNDPVLAELKEAFERVSYNRPASTVVVRAKRRRHRRRMILGAVPAFGLVAWGYTVTQREITSGNALGCAESYSQHGNMTISEKVPGETPEETCTRLMTETGQWEDPPANPVQCVTHYGRDGGGLLVVPAPEGLDQEDACSAIGAAVPPED